MPDSPDIQSGYNDDLRNLAACICKALREARVETPGVITNLLIQDIWSRFSGLSIYIPKIEAKNRRARNTAILKEYQEGAPVRWLAKRYGMTTQMIYTILDNRMKIK